MNTIKSRMCALLIMCVCVVLGANAQKSYYNMEQLTVNENVSTIITASEPIKLVDISTDSVVGDKPLDNVIRLKPKTGNHNDGDVLGIVTIITERYRVQYAMIYTSKLQEAVTDKEVELVERNAFHNPEVSMSTVDMVSYAMNLPFDIDELRVKLQDKKQQKSTNVQTIELKPALVLDRSIRFKKGYRNIIVLKKMTFPNDKVLTIELSEKQISGRTISMNLDYEDVLAADAFDTLLLREE